MSIERNTFSPTSVACLLIAVASLAIGLGIGWWARGTQWQDELNAEVERVAIESGGVFIPELNAIYAPPKAVTELNPERKQEVLELLGKRMTEARKKTD